MITFSPLFYCIESSATTTLEATILASSQSPSREIPGETVTESIVTTKPKLISTTPLITVTNMDRSSDSNVDTPFSTNINILTATSGKIKTEIFNAR